VSAAGSAELQLEARALVDEEAVEAHGRIATPRSSAIRDSAAALV
jgi:hypothetical protein